MTHKSGVKADSGCLFSEFCVTVCFALSALDACLEECDCPWKFSSTDDDAPAISEAELGCGFSVVNSNNDDDDGPGLSIDGATASDADFWRDGELGTSVTLDKSMAGSEDILQKSNVQKIKFREISPFQNFL